MPNPNSDKINDFPTRRYTGREMGTSYNPSCQEKFNFLKGQ